MTELTFGDQVVVSAKAPIRYRPGSKGWVVALALPDRKLVTIEFEDGSSMDLPLDLVEKVD